MIKEITITVKPEQEKNKELINKFIKKEISEKELNPENLKITSIFEKKSIDARHGQIKIHLRYKIFIGEPIESTNCSVPEWKKAGTDKTVLIVGSGPAGLFGALKLLEYGIKPIIIERGSNTQQRRKDIALISTRNLVDLNSNYCFGEGGAGTFSDGKLYTRSNKRGNISSILRIFNHFGADEKILTDAHPHIGTDKLPKVINSIREEIIRLGGEFIFNTKVISLIPLLQLGTEQNQTDIKIKGVHAINTITNEEKDFFADAVMLATGHSAPDIYSLIAKLSPNSLEAKTFAIGVRVEHPRHIIDSIQYHGKQTSELGAAEYRVTTQVEDRGVYSFCMCPGGFVVPSASGPDEIVVNGMSTASRNSKWSNAALVVEVRPEDIPSKYVEKARANHCEALAGLIYRSEIEKKAKENGDGQAAPAQLMVDFIENKKSIELPETSYTPGIISSNLNDWLPENITSRLKQGFININKNMHGFLCPQAVMIAPETRTSTPVRILRDKETYECIGIKNLFPAGEGSGYSGGIVSSAMDGENVCKQIALSLNK